MDGRASNFGAGPFAQQAPSPPPSAAGQIPVGGRTRATRRRPARGGGAGVAESSVASAPSPGGKYNDCYDKFKKTVMCRYLPRCRKGDDCPFAHTEVEKRARPDLTKTRLCAGYYDGRCKLDPSVCGFAHGEHELRANADAPQRPRDVQPQGLPPMETPAPPLMQVSEVHSMEASPIAHIPTYFSISQPGAFIQAPAGLPGLPFTGSPAQGVVIANTDVSDPFVACDPERQASSSTRSGGSTPPTFPSFDDSPPPPTFVLTPYVMAAPGQAPIGGPLQPMVTKWVSDINSLTAVGSNQGNFQTPEDFHNALLKAMPDVYED